MQFVLLAINVFKIINMGATDNARPKQWCNVMLYNVDDFISTQIDTHIGYVQSDVHEFSTTVRLII